MSYAAQIEEIDASRSVGFPTSAGIRLFRSSAVGCESGAGVARGDSRFNDGDGRREGGELNLTPGLG